MVTAKQMFDKAMSCPKNNLKARFESIEEQICARAEKGGFTYWVRNFDRIPGKEQIFKQLKEGGFELSESMGTLHIKWKNICTPQ